MWGIKEKFFRLPARIIDGGGSVVATVGTDRQERVTLPVNGREIFFQDGKDAEIKGTQEGFDIYQLDENGERAAIQLVGPRETIKQVRLINGLTAEGVDLVTET